MTGMKIYLSNGHFLHFPGAQAADIDIIVTWFQNAAPDMVVTVKGETGPISHVHKAHIIRIEVNR